MFIKRILNWALLKERVEAHDYTPPMIREGDFWWCSIGENIGVEISGKGELFTRPVIVLKKFGNYSFFGITTTTKRHNGSWYVSFKFNNLPETAILSQGRVFSYKRLEQRIGSIDSLNFRKIKEAFIRLF